MITAESLGRIDLGNPKAIEALIKVLETTQNVSILWIAVESLEKIGTGNPKAIEALIKVLETTQNVCILPFADVRPITRLSTMTNH
jgi:HEAT repeat protein